MMTDVQRHKNPLLARTLKFDKSMTFDTWMVNNLRTQGPHLQSLLRMTALAKERYAHLNPNKKVKINDKKWGSGYLH